jgi:outer membrane lipoprotein-sorting protein
MRVFVATLPVLTFAALTAAAARAHPDSLARRAAAEELLAKSMATYAALTSYADSGTGAFETESTIDRGRFRTYFRKPRDFYFEWGRREYASKSGGEPLPLPNKQKVWWMVNGELETYDREAASHMSYPAATSNQPAALNGANAGTMQTITLISSLLFPKANLVGTLQEIVEISLAGTEDVGGHSCHKLVGIARSVYPSGAVTNVRPVAVWIDAQTLLIRKVFTDTPKGYPMNAMARMTYTLDPTPNPKLDDAKFRFVVPDAQR